MTDGIGRLSGYGNYGVGGYVPQRREEAPQNAPAQQQPTVQHQETQVDPSKVMEFMANNKPSLAIAAFNAYNKNQKVYNLLKEITSDNEEYFMCVVMIKK